MNIQEIATLVIAIATVVYTIGTFLLWKVTNETVRLTKLEISRKEQLLRATFVSSIYTGFREIYTSIITDKEQIKLLAKEQNCSEKQIREKYIASFLINHSYELFKYNSDSLIPSELWENIIIDMRELFKWKLIITKYIEIRPLFPSEFIEFIDKEIL